jgi:hypothetical protein
VKPQPQGRLELAEGNLPLHDSAQIVLIEIEQKRVGRVNSVICANFPDSQGDRVCEPTVVQNDSSAWKRTFPGVNPSLNVALATGGVPGPVDPETVQLELDLADRPVVAGRVAEHS